MDKIYLVIMIILCLIGILVLQFGFIFVLLGLLPSIVAYYIDDKPGTPIFKIVFACNMAAILPYLIPMMQLGLNFKYMDVSHVMGSPEIWLVVYSGAGAGWCLIYLCRYVARFFITMLYGYRIVSMEKMQKKLVAEWGNKII